MMMMTIAIGKDGVDDTSWCPALLMKHRKVVIAFAQESHLTSVAPGGLYFIVFLRCSARIMPCTTQVLPSKLLATHKRDTGRTNMTAQYYKREQPIQLA
jgi:hypothetical protein